MAIDGYSGEISNDQATIDSFLLPPLLRDMTHAQERYVDCDALGVSFRERTEKTKKLWINGYVTVYEAHDLQESFDTSEILGLMRVVRLKAQNIREQEIEGYYVDDSFSQLQASSHPDDRIQYFDPNGEAFKPMKIIGYAPNPESALFMEQTIQEQFALVLGHNVLHELSKRL